MEALSTVAPVLLMVSAYVILAGMLVTLSFIPFPSTSFFSVAIAKLIYPLAILNPFLPVVEIIKCIQFTLLLISGFTLLYFIRFFAGFVRPNFMNFAQGRHSDGSLNKRGRNIF